MHLESKRPGGPVITKLVRGLALAIDAGHGRLRPRGPARQAVSGITTLDGKPLPSGTVTFAPLDGATAATAEIRDGQLTRSPDRRGRPRAVTRSRSTP